MNPEEPQPEWYDEWLNEQENYLQDLLLREEIDFPQEDYDDYPD